MPAPASPGVAVLGCGAWGKNHVRVWDQLGHLRMACDSDPALLRALAAQYPRLGTSTDLGEVLDRSDVDAVVIATPARTHAALALRALKAGKDVLVEKPMALTAAEGEELAATAKALGRVLLVGHVLEYHPAVLRLRELVAEGALGRLRYVYSHRLSLGQIRVEENALWSFAPHDVAVMTRLLGAEPTEVTCQGEGFLNREVADVTLTQLRFPSGVRGHIFVSWLHPFKEHRFVAVGDRQMAVFDDTRPWAEKLVLYPHRVDWVQGQLPVAHKAEAVPVPLKQVEPLRAEAEHFLACIARREPPLTDGASGVRVLRVLEAAQRSLEGGGTVPVTKASPKGGAFVHPTAVVDEGATLAPGAKVWHFAHVMPGAAVGEGSILGQNVFVGKGVRIGARVKVQNNVSVYEGVTLEDEVFCGPSMVFTNVINPRSAVERKDEFRPTLVKRGATLGANSTVLCGHTIGAHAMVGAGAVVTKDVPDFAIATGVPARVTGWACACGNTLRFDGALAACACGRRFERRGEHVRAL